jgi:ribose/xylose/arabinose/galactoside ABC-type transport system permease subunit
VGDATPATTADPLRWLLRSDAAPLLLAVAWLAVVAPLRPEVVSAANLGYVVASAAPLLLLAVGQLFVLLVGGIDLSASAVVGLASVAGAVAMTRAESAAAGVAAMAAVGLAVGLFHGAAVAVLRMPAFLVTLATLIALGGAAVWATGAKPVTDLPDGFLALADGAGWGVAPGVWVAVGAAVLAHLLLARTVVGKQLYAVGLNPATARVSGVPVAARVVLAFALSGLCAGLAAALYTARLEVGLATLVPRDVLLDVLGAAVIGGASLRGGRGTVLGVAVGVLVITLIGNSLTLLDLDHWHVVMAKGGLIFLAACLDVLRTRGAT